MIPAELLRSPEHNTADQHKNHGSGNFQTSSLFVCQNWHIISPSGELQGLEARKQSPFSSGLLALGTVDISDWIILCR